MTYCSKCRKDCETMRTAKTCEKCAQWSADYYHRHKEQQAKSNKTWRQTEAGKTYQREACERWRKNNPERVKELVHSYTEKNKTKPSYRLNKAKQKSKQRGIEFALSLEDYSKLISDPCFYCEGKLGTVQVGTGLDRIDSTRGYVIDNVLSCCGKCNMIKGETFTVEETKAAVKAILTVRNLL